MPTVKDTATALLEAHATGSWEKDHPNFEAYTKAEFGLGRQRAWQIISAEKMRQALNIATCLLEDDNLSGAIKKLKEGHLAALRGLDVAQAISIVKEAAKAPRNSARNITEVRQRIIGDVIPKPDPNAKGYGVCPTCKRPI